MPNYNKIILAGNLTRDPQLAYLPSNTPVTEIGLAVNRDYTTADGQKREETLFIDAVAFGKAAEILAQYMTKGRPLLIDGRLKLETWTDQEGRQRSKHKVIIENFTFLGGPAASERGEAGGSGGRRAVDGPELLDDDDIPF